MAAVVVAALPLLLLACSAILQTSPDTGEMKTATGVYRDPTYSPLDGASASPSRDTEDPAAEHILLDVLRRCDAHKATFLRQRKMVESFIAAATAHLRTLSPLFANATLGYDGSAFEGTRATDSADFDTYALLDGALLRQFELQRGTRGRMAARLVSGVDRDALPADLAALLTRDSFLNARRFKQWTFAQLAAALQRAAEEYPHLRPEVYVTRGAAGVNLTTEDGTTVQVDYAAHLAPPPTTGHVLRPTSLRPCRLQLVPPGRTAPWTLYSDYDLEAPAPAQQCWFVANAMQLEHDLLSAQPLLRSVTRMLKTLSAARSWHQRFHVESFMLKHAVFWSYADGCGRPEWGRRVGLLPPTLASLRAIEQALRRGRLDKFFDRPPAEDALRSLSGGRPAMLLLADEIHDVIATMSGGGTEALRRLFQL